MQIIGSQINQYKIFQYLLRLAGDKLSSSLCPCQLFKEYHEMSLHSGWTFSRSSGLLRRGPCIGPCVTSFFEFLYSCSCLALCQVSRHLPASSQFFSVTQWQLIIMSHLTDVFVLCNGTCESKKCRAGSRATLCGCWAGVVQEIILV